MKRRLPLPPPWFKLTLAGILAGLASTCLPTDPGGPVRIDFEVPDSLLLAVSQTATPTIVVRADGQVLNDPNIIYTSLDAGVATVDTAATITAVGRGTTGIAVTVLTAAAGETPLEDTITINVIIANMTPAPAETTLTALGDTMFFGPEFLDVNGNALSADAAAAITPTYELLSAGDAVELNTSTGAVVAKATGVDTLRATVDTSRVDLVARVVQVPAGIRVTPDTLEFAALDASFQWICFHVQSSLTSLALTFARNDFLYGHKA